MIVLFPPRKEVGIDVVETLLAAKMKKVIRRIENKGPKHSFITLMWGLLIGLDQHTSGY